MSSAADNNDVILPLPAHQVGQCQILFNVTTYSTCACSPMMNLLPAKGAVSCAVLWHLWSCAVKREVDAAPVHT